jgi:hypothetical protein
MEQQVYKTEGVNRTKNMRFYSFVFTGDDSRKGWRGMPSARSTTPLNQKNAVSNSTKKPTTVTSAPSRGL